MVFSSSMNCLLLHIFIVVSFVSPINSSQTQNHQSINQTFRSEQELQELKKTIATRLRQINKPAVKTIQVPNGDIIDCVLTHKQLAFDHPLLKGQKPMDFPKSLREHKQFDNMSDFQFWSLSGESCPEGTIPIRRVTEQDMLRAHSINSFGTKAANPFPHEHAVALVDKDEFFGAQATFNVWSPYLESQSEFSLSQMWLVSGSYGKDLNSIEAGWHIYPRLYGDNNPRFFVYWTADAYQSTGCHNLMCPGFVQTNKNFPVGGSIPKLSTYNGQQFGLPLKIMKDKNTGNWLLTIGDGNIVGYWPATLFTHLKYVADEVHFGGEIVNAKATGSHTSTAMGSGHFAEEGYGKAAYIRNMQVIDSDNNLIPLANPIYLASNPNCYNIQGNTSPKWGDHIYFGGPGRSDKCP
ncbi:protein neprosin-like [Vicia villosa]|uniref:protein neprosin-like n=1 Tax=Vicia villosa TaxID=3911 RepID=UPI00273CBBEE|nr:protein neprosin-like [Vicia villosa]XP_058772098.1 protein neprosin-like [Vicia villosa]